MKLKVAARTDVGLLSDHNEDYFLVQHDLGLYLVADGVGGLEAGELASKVACQLIEQAVRRGLEQDPGPPRHDQLLARAIRDANAGLFEVGQRRAGKQGIGTTITALWFHGDRVLFACVGDSRVYLYRRGLLRQLSRDQKAGRFHLAASLGQEHAIDVRLGMVRLRQGDRFLLCTDGLHGPVPKADMATLLDSVPDPRECSERLIFKANQEGGPDNITALLADVAEPDPPQPWRFSHVWLEATSPMAPFLRRQVFVGAAVAALLALVALWLVNLTQSPSDEPTTSAIGGRIAALAAEANERAAKGETEDALNAIEALLRHAVRDGQTIDRASLGLRPPADKLWGQAATSTWDEYYAPAARQLATLAGTPGQGLIETEIKAAREQLDRAHQEYLSGDYRSVAAAFSAFNAKVDAAVQRATGELARWKDSLANTIKGLRQQASEFPADNPVRRAAETHLQAAEEALKADHLDRASSEAEAARAALEDGKF